MRAGMKLLLVVVAVAAIGVLIGLYVSNLTTLAGSPSYSVPVQNVNGHPVVNLEIQTVAAVGPKLSQNPDWVSYLIHTSQGWERKTVWDLPANATVHVTIYNFDGASGLRNPYLARPQGMVGNRVLIDGKPANADRPERRVAHVRGPGVRTHRRHSGRGRRCQEPVRLRAVLCHEERAPHDQVHVPHDRARPLPLAVLRPLRGRLDLRVRRADADDRLHGRLPQREGLMASEPAAATPATDPTSDGVRVVVAWLVLSAIATPLVAIYVGPLIPPGNGSVQARDRSSATR